MIESIVFVHGTGVRKASYEVTADKVLKALRGRQFKGRFEPCLWGDKHGAALAKDGKSIPKFEGVAAPKPDAEAYRALWALLAEDAYFELRELSASAPAGRRVAPAAVEELVALPARLRGLAGNPKVSAALAGEADATILAGVLDQVAASDPLKAALTAAPQVDTALRQGVARAVVALLQAGRADGSPLEIDRREALVVALVDGLGGVEMGKVSDWIGKRLTGLGLRWLTDAARRKRDVLYNAAYPAAGDILLYQARGDAIRSEIGKSIDACGQTNVAVIAHSLGGIATFDLLVKKPRPQVKLLVTAGSQAPLLFEMRALHSFEDHGPLPATFPPRWINFFDPDDLLSYQAAPVFDRASPEMEVRDIEVRSGQPFPLSHSAYWESTKLWDRLEPYLAKA